jgi:hypothetical protein
LQREVIPVLRDVETDGGLPAEEVGAALAYLEAMWDEATLRAEETDAAHSHLRSREEECAALGGPAGRYHAAVRVLRGIVAERVRPFVGRALEHSEQRAEAHARGEVQESGLRVKDARPGGCAPRIA